MIPGTILPLIRRAIVDLLHDIGSQQNDAVIAHMLNDLGHRVARRDVVDQLRWLADAGLVTIEEIEPFVLAEIRPDGSDVAEGRLRIDGVSRLRTGAS